MCDELLCDSDVVWVGWYVYYCRTRTYMKGVRGRGGDEGGRALWDATSRSLRGRVGPPHTNVRVSWVNCVREEGVGWC